jgi:hypothetical protein
MHSALVLFAMLVLPPDAAAARTPAQPPVASPVDSIAWEFPDSAIAAAAVDRFEASYDKQPAIKVPLTARVAGTDTYKTALPPLTPGLHVVTVVACNVSACGPVSALDFQLVIVPAPVLNLRSTKGS